MALPPGQAELQKTVASHTALPQPLGRNIPSLPIDIVREVMGYIKDCRSDLKVCCLMSPPWLDCARAHLHRTARIATMEDVERWTRLVDSCPFIASHFLRRIKLRLPPSLGTIGWGLEGTTYRFNAAEWEQWHAFWEDRRVMMDRLVQFATSRCLTVVEDLDMLATFSSPLQAKEFFSCFQNIKTLNIHHIWFGESGSSLNNLGFLTGALKTLGLRTLDPVTPKLFADWKDVNNLSRLRVTPFAKNGPEIAAIIERSASTLEELFIQPNVKFGSKFGLDNLPFPESRIIPTSLPNLRKICFGVQNTFIDDLRGQYNEQRSDLCYILEAIKHMPVLLSVTTIDFWVSTTESTARSGMEHYCASTVLHFKGHPLWQAIFNPSTMAKFPNAKVIRVRVTDEGVLCGPEKEKVERDLREQTAELGVQVSIAWDDGREIDYESSIGCSLMSKDDDEEWYAS